MHEGPSTSVAIPSHEVEVELERILASLTFRRAPRHSRFLSFVVRESLNGSVDCVKESVIGVEVFDRPAGYDPGAEPMVRVEAGRLRLRLAEYYKELGRHDAIHIDLPRGAYVPVFSRNGVEPALEEPADRVSEAGSPQRRDEVVRPRDERRRPAAIVVVAAMVVIGIAAYLLIRVLARDTWPAAERLEGSTLIISNAKGEELWRKSFSEGFLPDYHARGVAPRIWFGDLNGDGHAEVLFAYRPGVNPTTRSATLICYLDRGKEAWRWTPGRALPELEGSPATFDIRDFVIMKGSAKTHARIVVAGSHVPFHLSQIAILDAKGKMISEYWHSGI